MRGSFVAPCGVRFYVFANANVIKSGIAFVWVARTPIARLQYFGTDVFERDVPLNELPGLVQHLPAARVKNRFVGKHAADPLGHVFKVEDMVGR